MPDVTPQYRASASGSSGPAVDSRGDPVIDPTKNVLDLVAAAIQRQDDLRIMESRHVQEMSDLRSAFYEKLRDAESARIDAIRAVDVGNVQRAAEVQATQALTLATQVSTSAEALRTQVAAAATAQTIALNAALDPIQKRIDDLTRAQYEAQGQKTQVIDTRADTDTNINATTLGIYVVLAVISIASLLFAIFKH